MYSPDVFNTGAHPFKAPQAKDTYGGGTSTPTQTVPFSSEQGEPPVAQISPCPALGDRLTNIVTEVLDSILDDVLGGLGL